MGLFERIVGAVGAKAKSAIHEGTPIDAAGTHAVVPLVKDVFHGGGEPSRPARPDLT